MFQQGQIANPEGRRAEQARDLPFRAALVRRLETTSNPAKLDKLADALVKQVKEGGQIFVVSNEVADCGYLSAYCFESNLLSVFH